ncbi:helix-turn-helix transcriptional regulator [Klebsiella variicola]|uniref:helix-turn-helix transcriptional regulator n=1 Tax=Klebsiella variicola TaxID=244366 RepID=UPI002B0543E6|nr:LuxR C-terminal-related transcriptional regulator [Klebsiella variicola]
MSCTTPKAFASSCLETISHLVSVSSIVFYLVDEALRPNNYILHCMPENIHEQYINHFHNFDPLRPACFQCEDAVMVSLSPTTIADNPHYYYDFMLPNHHRDITEIFIRQRRRIVAGVSLLRDTPFTDSERCRLRAVLPLLEVVSRDLLPERDVLSFTAKEQEIVNLVREGASNKRIAMKLGISLSTVKTHLRNIFAKTNAINRTELVSNGFYAHS